MRETWKRSALLATLLVAAAAGGCAQDIGDIDRTEPNKIKKSDLTEGVWWMSQKVTHVDAIAGEPAGFEGIMSDLDKVVFVAEENYLIAYRSYSTLPGSDDTTKNFYGSDSFEELYDSNYQGTIKAVFPISSHFDVQRQYDTATGEQSNVIVENTNDRNWWEREYMRVDWTANPIINFDLWANGMFPIFELGYQHAADLSEDGSDPAAPYFERDKDGTLVYFDAPATYIIQPSIYDCVFGQMLEWYYGTCTSTEARVVTSFARDLGSNDYEPVVYSNQDMNRFGYFRSERFTYDPYLGIMNAGKIQLANRHNIWKENRVKNEDGSYKYIPLHEREVRTIPYYVRGLVDEPYLEGAAYRCVEDWNDAFKQVVRIIRQEGLKAAGKPVDNALTPNDFIEQVERYGRGSDPKLVGRIKNSAVKDDPDIYVLCHVPVQVGDNTEVCGPVGYSPREGDFRKSVIWMVNQRQDVGLLGYGPGASDPLTGETLSGNAHVYVSAMNRQANSIVDFIKYINGDLTEENLSNGSVNAARAKSSANLYMDLLDKGQIAQTRKTVTARDVQKREAKRLDMVNKKANLRKFDYLTADAVQKTLFDKGYLATDLDAELVAMGAKRLNLTSTAQLPEDALKALSTYNHFSIKNRELAKQIKRDMGAKGFCFDEKRFGFDPNYASIAREYEGRHDYDNILREVRSRVYVATTLHEMGHSFGLRHNFGATYDTINYQNHFWELRPDENFNKEKISSPEEMLKLYKLSDKQLGSDYSGTANGGLDSQARDDAYKGGIPLNRYSSIMDYAGGATSDFNGLGKYDIAAILYAYSKGYEVTGESEALCKVNGGTWESGKCYREASGIVEVFDKKRGALGAFGEIVTHKDTTGAVAATVNASPDGTGIHKYTAYSTFDDTTTIGQPYMELVHYHDVAHAYPGATEAFKANKLPGFVTERTYARLDDYLASKVTEGDNAMVRVPYYFCTDDNAGKLASCNRFDDGADLLENMNYAINEYENYYWFTDFARGRSFWDSWAAASRHEFTFMTMSDLFQWWLVSEGRLDDFFLKDINRKYGFNLNSNVGNAAIHAGFNALARAIATPEYGLYCKRRDNGALYSLSTDDEARADTNEFSRVAYCGTDPEYYYVKQGQGRRRHRKYDVNMGFDYSIYEYELQHNLTSLMAMWALFDVNADVIANTGDMGTYSISFYDYFESELTNLMNGVYAEDYSVHSPYLLLDKNETVTSGSEESKTGDLFYYPMALAAWRSTDEKGESVYYEYDPATGRDSKGLRSLTGNAGHYQSCASNKDCIVSGRASDAFCESFISDEPICMQLYDTLADAEAECPSGTTPYDVYGNMDGFFCLPASAFGSGNLEADIARLASAKCSLDNTVGACDAGQVCSEKGVCVTAPVRVETNSSLTQKVYFPYFGMLYTLFGDAPNFAEQYNIFMMGAGEEVAPAKGYKTITFENPFTGEVYGANALDCSSAHYDSSLDLPDACRGDMQYVARSGAAKVIDLANAKSKIMHDAYMELIDLSNSMSDADFADESSEKYNEYINVLYRWNMALYETQYAIRDITYLRSYYRLFTSIW